MKQINRNLLKAVLSLCMTLIFVGAVLYLFTSDSLSNDLYGADSTQILNDTRIQLSLLAIICSGTGLLLLNLK